MTFSVAASILSPEAISAASKSAEKQSLQSLQSKMKCDPESYVTELTLIYKQFSSSLDLFKQQAALSFTSLSGVSADGSVAKDLGDKSMFLSHMSQFYPNELVEFPKQLVELLRGTARTLPSGLRCQLAQALILLCNRNVVSIGDTLALFMELQTLGDRNLKKLAFSHVVRFIQRMNKKHRNEAKNKPLQNVLFQMLQREEEAIAKRALVTLCDLHRRKVWFDDRTVNAICMACFHPSSRIMKAALLFLLDFEKIQDDGDSDASDSEDEANVPTPQITLSREDVYKAHHKGTTKSKRKKQAKLQRVARSMKKQQRLDSEKAGPNYYSPLTKLNDAQGFAEKLFSRLQSCNERFEVKMMLLKVVARTIGLHQLILLNFYPYLQKYVQPHQREITDLLAAAVQACHDMVPPDAVEPLFRQVVNQFVHDRSRTEAITIGLNVVREICLRIPLLMTEDLLQDLVLYKKSNEKSVSSAARALITLFREVCPSLLVKKDRGRPTDPKAKPKAYGEVNIATNVPGAELLELDNQNDEDDSDSEGHAGSGSEVESDGNAEGDITEDADSIANSGSEDDATDEDSGEDEAESESVTSEEGSGHEDLDEMEDEGQSDHLSENGDSDVEGDQKSETRKRKRNDFDRQLDSANTSLRALKKLAAGKLEKSFESDDPFYTNEDFQRIKELQAEEKAKTALAQHGLLKGSNSKSVSFKIPNSDQLHLKPVDPSKLEAHIRKKMTKEQRVALMKAGREDRTEYTSRAATKQKKKGGLSNKQKESKKKMPLGAKRARATKSKAQKSRKQRASGKQFRGKKAWK